MIKFPTDFHLGKKLQANTTFQSRKRLTQKLYDSALDLVKDATDTIVFCGDLFNSYSNDEAIIAQGFSLCSEMNWTMAGNHDLTNREDVVGSLQLLKNMFDEDCETADAIVLAKVGQQHYQSLRYDEIEIFLVPHHSDQTVFEKTLQDVITAADESAQPLKILCLHCNYNMPWEKNETTLALTDDDGEVLLDSFDYVLIGHEHNSNTYHKGKLIMLGNHHPTGFADIADKFIWSFDGEKMIKELIWEKKKHYLELKPFEEVSNDTDDIQFIRIVGDLASEDYPKFSKWMVAQWKVFPNAYAIKNSVVVQRLEVENKIDEKELESLPETIRKELKGTAMEPIYDNLLAKAGEL